MRPWTWIPICAALALPLRTTDAHPPVRALAGPSAEAELARLAAGPELAVAPVAVDLVRVQARAQQPDRARAQPPARARHRQGEDVLVRVNGPVYLAAGDTVSTLVVVNNDARIDGVVRNQLVVVNGTATVEGALLGGVVAVNSRMTLGAGSRVEGDITLVRSTLDRDPGATVAGTIQERQDFAIPWAFLWALWFGMAVAILVAGLLFAWLGGRQLTEAGRLMTGEVGPTLLASLVLWVVLPAIAFLLFFTVVGIPLGLAVLLILLPAVWFVGYLVAGAAVGLPITRRFGWDERPDRPYRSVLVGLVILLLVALIPVVGGLIAMVAGLWGAGALLYRSWRERRRGRPTGGETEERAAA